MSEEFDTIAELGSSRISANLWGFHLSENPVGDGVTDVWLSPGEAQDIVSFIQYWTPQIENMRPPKCPTCYEKHAPHSPDEDPQDCEMRTYEPGNALRWHCVFCGREYQSGPFGENLREIG
jgi:hypothetical protein